MRRRRLPAAMIRKLMQQREARVQQAPEPGGPTLRELRAANQDRLRKERGES